MNTTPETHSPSETAADTPSGDACCANLRSRSAARLEKCVQQHPGATMLAAVGLGAVALLAFRALTPPPPRHRAVQLLEDIQGRLSELAHMGYDRVASLAEDGAHTVGKGVDQLGRMHLDRKLGRLGQEIKNLFHA